MKKVNKNIIQSGYYQWKIYIRNGVYYVDGRSNGTNAGKLSLGTKNRDEAIKNLRILDMQMAARNGNAEAAAQLEHKSAKDISIDSGIELYLAHVKNRQQIEHRSPKTLARYKAILEKFQEFLTAYTQNTTWGQISDAVLEEYAGWLSRDIEKKEFKTLQFRRHAGRYAQKTLQIEIDTIKQAVKYLDRNKHFKPRHELVYSVAAPDISERYCYTYEEVQEILKLTESSELMWLHDICLMLSKSGVRIGELINMRWDDLVVKDGNFEELRLANGKLSSGIRRRTKNRQDRSVPLHKSIAARLSTYQKSKDGYIFHGPLGGRAKEDTIRLTLQRQILPLVEKDLKKRGISSHASKGCLHSFRHYFCSQCVMHGMQQQVIQKIMGHKDSSMVQHYLHLNTGDIRGIIDKVEL